MDRSSSQKPISRILQTLQNRTDIIRSLLHYYDVMLGHYRKIILGRLTLMVVVAYALLYFMTSTDDMLGRFALSMALGWCVGSAAFSFQEYRFQVANADLYKKEAILIQGFCNELRKDLESIDEEEVP